MKTYLKLTVSCKPDDKTVSLPFFREIPRIHTYSVNLIKWGDGFHMGRFCDNVVDGDRIPGTSMIKYVTADVSGGVLRSIEYDAGTLFVVAGPEGLFSSWISTCNKLIDDGWSMDRIPGSSVEEAPTVELPADWAQQPHMQAEMEKIIAGLPVRNPVPPNDNDDTGEWEAVS